ncbi:hypothetical protein [uncultured Metabacillus sp.]|uniref:hypothetical protein n=1 Tax=uncultured Metabacillus sp. TaxID=2860135 RepID=UPI002626FC0D|nr:hypothetical protein [uncultured Metabacillus sp.]
MKITRKGDVLTGYDSEDGENWIEVGSKEIKMGEKVYIGFAVDAAKNTSAINHYNTAVFSAISLIGDIRK